MPIERNDKGCFILRGTPSLIVEQHAGGTGIEITISRYADNAEAKMHIGLTNEEARQLAIWFNTRQYQL